MSTINNSIHTSNTPHPVIHAVVNGYLQAHGLHRFYRLSAWLARRWKKELPSIAEEGYRSDDERLALYGNSQVTADQAVQERIIDIQTVFLLLTSIR